MAPAGTDRRNGEVMWRETQHVSWRGCCNYGVTVVGMRTKVRRGSWYMWYVVGGEESIQHAGHVRRISVVNGMSIRRWTRLTVNMMTAGVVVASIESNHTIPILYLVIQ